MLSLRIRRLASSGARILGYGRRPETYSDGCPRHLGDAVLEEVVTRETGEAPLGVQHARLPTSGGFFAAQTFRVRVQLPAGGTWSAIYKTVDLSPDQGTGFRREVDRRLAHRLDSVPLLVWGGNVGGASDRRREGLARYIPDVYHVAQSPSGRQYEVLQEDLAELRPADGATVGMVIRALPDLHDSLRDYISTREPHQFASDAAAYELAVDECVVQAISDYAAAYASRRATAIAAQFGPVAEWQSKNRHRFPTHAIHGDFVASNVLVAKSDSSFKVIDWERTMIGFPHRDLAALIRNLPARMERPSLDLYARAVPDLSATDHAEAFVLSKRMQKLKAAAIGSVRLLQRDCGSPGPDGRRRGSCRVLRARIEQNLGVAEALGERLLGD